MSTRTVKRITRTGRRAPSQTFAFTESMIPSRNGQTPDFVRNYRRRAWEAFDSLPLPHTRLEPWRRTDLRAMNAGSFRLPPADAYLDYPNAPAPLTSPLVGDRHGGLIVLRPGKVESRLDDELKAKGVIFTDYASAEKEHPEVLEKILGAAVGIEEDKFAAATAAFADTGVVLYVPRGVDVEFPLHSVLWAPGEGLAYFNHLLIYLDDGASVTYIHEAASPEEQEQTMHACIVEGHVGQNANLRFIELQSLGEHVWNFMHERIRVARDGNVDWIVGAMGTHLTKAFSNLELEGQGSSGRMSGFFFTDGNQHLDLDTQQDHLAPNTTSDLLYKGALKGKSRSVWQGMIYVAPGAQKTDGYQANRNLVLEPSARADSIPGLEILADDVRCTHGATIGKIDPEQLFYLQTRGVPTVEAQRLIVEGFFAPVMDRIPFDGVRERFLAEIQEKMRL